MGGVKDALKMRTYNTRIPKLFTACCSATAR
jgi:hypothetical protein